jgi:hypothetical protein
MELFKVIHEWDQPFISDIKVVTKKEKCPTGYMPIFGHRFSGLRPLYTSFNASGVKDGKPYLLKPQVKDKSFISIWDRVRGNKHTESNALTHGFPPLNTYIYGGNKICGKNISGYMHL